MTTFYVVAAGMVGIVTGMFMISVAVVELFLRRRTA